MLLTDAEKKGTLDSCIGYPQNIELIKRWTGINILLNRSETKLDNKDSMLVMKLNYRVTIGVKGQEVNEDNFEFFKVKYTL